MKALAQSLKSAFSRNRKPYVVSVGLDIFGNAIPAAKSTSLENSGGVSRIVRHQDMLVSPSRKRKPSSKRVNKAGGAFKTLLAFTPSLLARLRPWQMPAARRGNAASGSLLPVVRQRPIDHYPQTVRSTERSGYAFKALPQEFNERECWLEPRIIEPSPEPLKPLLIQRTIRAQVLPLAIIAFCVMAYLLYVMTGMQGSMAAMSGHIQTIATDTRAISQNMQSMNQSVHDMNHNVAGMNQKVGTLAQTAAPMGEAASTVSPLTKMFKSIMPF